VSIKKIFYFYSKKHRERRAKLFKNLLNPTPKDRILDLGSGDGSYIANILPFRENVYLADISEEDLKIAQKKYGFKNTILLKDDDPILPFPDKYFDIIFCSSVIEHVTGPKNKVKSIKDSKLFYELAFKYQLSFANEIRRISKKYFVQTPYKYFLIESHTWLPFIIVLLPRKLQIKLIDFLNNTKWPKKTFPDWNLLTIKDMKMLFPDAQIILEKSLLMTKSIIAVKVKDK